MIESNMIKIAFDQEIEEYKCTNLGEVVIPQTQKELKKVPKISNWYQIASFFLVLCILIGMIILMLYFWIGLVLVLVFFFLYFMVFGKFIQLTKEQENTIDKIIVPFKIQLKGVYKIKKQYEQKGCFQSNQTRTQLILVPANIQVPLYGQNMQDYDDNKDLYITDSSDEGEEENEDEYKSDNQKKKQMKKQHAKKQSIQVNVVD